MAAPKRGCVQEKAFLFSSKKRGARVACNRSGHEHQSAAVGRVLRVQGLIFSGKTLHESSKKRVRSKKAFLFSSKKRTVACNGSRFVDFADSIIYFIVRACFEGGITLREATLA